MYKVIIDYGMKKPIGHHWYGNFDGVSLPETHRPGKRFYNLISLDPRHLPEVGAQFALDRIYLPHYLNSDLTIDDLFFGFSDAGVVLLTDLVGTSAEVYADDVDHRPRCVEFELLADVQNPASESFDPEVLEYPCHQLGGVPYFKQPGGHSLSCCECRAPMVFLLQFDNDDDLDADFEDDGSAYFWWCSACSVVGCRVESA